MPIDTNYPISAEGEQEDLRGANTPEGEVSRWLKEIDLVLNSDAHRIFERAGERIVKTYKNTSGYIGYGNEALEADRVMYNVLWANVQILYPLLFARMPEPVVERWYKDSDPIGRQAAEIAECSTSFQLKTQQDRFMYSVGSAVRDMLLPGRGQVWLRFDCDWIEALDENGNPHLDKEGNAIRQAKPNTEKVVIDPLMWQDYLECMGRNQYEVRWRAKRAYMNRRQLMDRFGDKGEECKLQNFKEQVDRRKKLDDDEQFLMQAEVWEIEDFEGKKKYWISRGYKKAPLDVQDNPLNLSDFYSCPIPLLATTTSDSTYPTADYVIYERLASEVDWAMKRRSSIFECIRMVGATSAAYNKEVKEMLRLNDGDLWPIANWAQFVENKGFAGIIDWMPFDQAVAALGPMTEYIADCLQKIDAITGVPDFAHGVTDPNESVASVQKRAQFTQPKIVVRQQDVQRFCREIVRKTAEIIFEPGLFSDETIALMYGLAQRKPEDQATFPQALSLLRDDRMRTFRVDIETDSTIASDEADNQARWAQYMQSIGAIFSNVQAVQQFRPELMHPMLESALGSIRALRTGRNVEGAWEKAISEIEDADMQAKMNPQPPPPDPALLRAQNEQQKIQIDAQIKSQELQWEQYKTQYDWQFEQGQESFKQYIEQAKLQQDSYKTEGELAVKHEANQIDAQEQLTRNQVDKVIADMDIFQAELKNKLEAQKIAMQAALEAERLDFEKKAEILRVQEKIMEERRLTADQQLEHKRMLLEHKQAMHEVKEAKAEKNKPKEEKKTEAPKPPDIHVHLGSRKSTIKKNADGSYSKTDED